jgi:hypothetical protein
MPTGLTVIVCTFLARMQQAPRTGSLLIELRHIPQLPNVIICISHQVLLHFQDIKLLPVCYGVGNISGQVAVAVKIPGSVGRPLTQRQREVGALQ